MPDSIEIQEMLYQEQLDVERAIRRQVVDRVSNVRKAKSAAKAKAAPRSSWARRKKAARDIQDVIRALQQ